MPKSLRGSLLVAAKSLRDPNFYKTVVLMIDHTSKGATGVVINRPTAIQVNHALSGHFQLPDSEDVIYSGGPVEPTALLMLHDVEEFGSKELSPVERIFVGGSSESFEEVVKRGSSGEGDAHFRIYLGYAGWGTEQLEGEIARGDWLVTPADHDSLFTADPYDLYERLLQRVFEANRMFPYTAKDPNLN